MTAYTDHIDSILGRFKSKMDAEAPTIQVVYESSEPSLKPHPRDSGRAWARIVVRHNDATKNSLPNADGMIHFRRYGFVWVQIFVPADFASAWGTASDLAEIAQQAYERVADTSVTFLKAAVIDKPNEGRWVRKDMKAFFYWDEVRTPAVVRSTGGVTSISAHALLGITDPPIPTALQIQAHLLAQMTIGADAGINFNDQQNLTAQMALGIAAQPLPTVDRFRFLQANMSLGANMTPLPDVSRVAELASAMHIGFDEAAQVLLVKNFAVSMGIGVGEAAQILTSRNLSASMGLGISEAATVRLQRNLVAAMALGVTDASALTLVSPTDPSGLFSTDLALWYSADSGVTQASNKVSSWADKVAGVAITQATGGNQPTFNATGLNSKPTIQFDPANNGTATFLRSTATAVTMGTHAVCYVVTHLRGLGVVSGGSWITAYLRNGGTFPWQDAGSVNFMALDQATGKLQCGQNGSNRALTTVTNNTTYRMGMELDGTNITAFLNNVQGTQTALSVTLGTPGAFEVGAEFEGGAAGSTLFRGDISEIVVIKRGVTSTERTNLDNWFKFKWGL